MDFSLLVHSPNRTLMIKSIDFTVSTSYLTFWTTLSGKIRIGAIGGINRSLDDILSLTKDNLTTLLDSLNITWILIDTWDPYRLNDTFIELDIGVRINTSRYFKDPGGLREILEDLDSGRHIVARFAVIGNKLYYLIEIDYEEDINTFLSCLSRIIYQLNITEDIFGPLQPRLLLFQYGDLELSGYLVEFSNEYQILESRSNYYFETTMDKTILYFESPRIILKNTSSPGDTIHSLYTLLSQAAESAPEEERLIGIDYILGTLLNIDKEPSLIVLLDGEEAKTINVTNILRFYIGYPETTTTTSETTTTMSTTTTAEEQATTTTGESTGVTGEGDYTWIAIIPIILAVTAIMIFIYRYI